MYLFVVFPPETISAKNIDKLGNVVKPNLNLKNCQDNK
jgi:hypothetical protein